MTKKTKYAKEDKSKVIIIEVQGGCVVDVKNIPKNYEYIIKDKDN